jgi:glycogen(starch) synthase
MRILIVSNFYPPHVLGGYELGCQDVVKALEARGHTVAVLTSCHGVGKPTTEGSIFRWLHHAPLNAPSTDRNGHRRQLLRLEVRNQLAFDRAWLRHRPEVVSLWNLAKIPMSLALRAEARGAVCYYVSDSWLAQWTEPGWYEDGWHRANTMSSQVRTRVASGLLRTAFRLARLTWTTADLKLQHVQFCSAFMKNATLRAGRSVADADVVHWGVDTTMFVPDETGTARSDRWKRLLYVGQVLPHKGVHTAIRALRRLHDAGAGDATLTVVGACHHAEYGARLREQVASSNLSDAVIFAGPQSRERLPGIYREHGVLVFPSCWGEPFAITPLEAMASGLAVVGTLAGGSGEIFEDGVNALTFREEDAEACATQIHRLIAEPSFAAGLAERGRRTVRERFTLSAMVDRIESRLQIAGNASFARS